jgi:hypothetical protein
MQLWVVHHIISQIPFDIWDLMLCEMEDTLEEGFKGHRQLPYAHWICFLIQSVCDLPAEILKGSRCPRGGVNWAFLKIKCKK